MPTEHEAPTRDQPRPDLGRRRFLAGAAATALAGSVAAATGVGLQARLAAASSPNRCRPGSSGNDVLVLGGGMGGLAAAHELIERGFSVTVIERKALGGKSRSIPIPGTGSEGRPDLPGEHGFRFFPGFYHHVPDTMRRIPLPGGGVVYDNLVHASTTSFARAGRADFLLYTDVPPEQERNLEQLLRFINGVAVGAGTIPPHEAAHFVKQMLMFMTSSEQRRLGQWEHLSWWDFVGAADRSDEYQKMLATGLTRNLVAAKAELASSRTIGRIAEAFFTNAVYRDESQGEGPPDQVLNAPSNDAWIDPWVAHLSELGVRFQVGYRVERLELVNGRIVSAQVRDGAGNLSALEADWFICALPVEVARTLWSSEILDADPRLEGMNELHVDWMNGIQYYLDRRLDVIRGHYSFVDSPWALTSLNQQQFWPRTDLAGYGDGRVRDILSVDISNWHDPGILYGKPAKECTREEIAQETWAQITQHLNDQGTEVIPEGSLLTWYLDPAITIRAGHATTNDEPLLINTIGSWEHRPEATTAIPNLFLASDYVQTDIDLATMEAANESGRAAVNAILAESGSSAPSVRMYHLFDHPELAAFRAVDAERYRAGQPHALEVADVPPGLPWPLENLLPDLQVDAGVVTPIEVTPIASLPAVAATTDAPVRPRDDAGIGELCQPGAVSGVDPAQELGSADGRAAPALLPRTGAGLAPGRAIGLAAAGGLAALLARRAELPPEVETPRS